MSDHGKQLQIGDLVSVDRETIAQVVELDSTATVAIAETLVDGGEATVMGLRFGISAFTSKSIRVLRPRLPVPRDAEPKATRRKSRRGR